MASKHVTFFRMKTQPGKIGEIQKIMQSMDDMERLKKAGWTGTVIGQSKTNADEIFGVVTWDTTERYMKNAETPEQDADFQQMRKLLTADPEWFDCDVVSEERP